MKLKLINGPNLDRLGKREPDIYGSTSLTELNRELVQYAQGYDIGLECFQSNSESDIIQNIHASDDYDGLIINPAAYTHTSVAIRDALATLDIPKIEVHISNIHKRESFRHVSYTVGECTGQICGLGTAGYKLAIDYFRLNHPFLSE